MRRKIIMSPAIGQGDIMRAASRAITSACLILVLALLSVARAEAGAVWLPGAGGARFLVPVTSFKEARFRTVVRQRFDFSCGSAAVASLLSYHYQDPVTEQQVFTAMYERGDKAKIRSEGFSLLDMKFYLEERGYRADGYRISLDKLASTGIPAIVLISADGYLHFVVIKGIDEQRVLLGDPARGLTIVERQEFEGMWNGIAFIIRDKMELAQQSFNLSSSWMIVAKAPLGAALSPTSLASFTTLLPPRSDF